MIRFQARQRPRTRRYSSRIFASAVVAVTLATAPATAISAASGPSFVGPLLSRSENSKNSWGRDGAFSVPLPNGKDLWVFGDTPHYQLSKGKWIMTNFITGNSAGLMTYTPGKAPTGRFDEVNIGKQTKPSNKPARLMSVPRYNLPDGSGHACIKFWAGGAAEAVRWPTGAALMPDKKNVLITYAGGCAYNLTHVVEAWGFALYNWKTNRFTKLPTDVFPADKAGTRLAYSHIFSSPVISDGNVTFYSWSQDGHSIFSTTVPADRTSLRNKNLYDPQLIDGLDPIIPLAVAPPSPTQPNFTMVQLNELNGRYEALEAPAPDGPWTQSGSGIVPGCSGRPSGPDYDPCFSISIHPEVSQTSRLLITYYLPGYGPGVGGNRPFGNRYFGHMVMAYLPN